ncbi:hypothetical protein SAMN05445756_1383 [Kytococcus aerolatus]|uniref:LytR cell envelope-related transcriptional attenuator n=1 Tax=Kytococcus aerolatus TaxID=592308 RepID=A0A212TI30_9MICO|nr:hypothetical protein [Kytococcus aerolatus]SNC65625.1 hypothetical protein SAMN05445756_1383 [Kytococcus aerolatus]
MQDAIVTDPYDPETPWARPPAARREPPRRRRRGEDLAFWGLVALLAAAALYGLSLILGLWPEEESTTGAGCYDELDAPRIYLADAGAGETAVNRASEQLRARGVVVLGVAEAETPEDGVTQILTGPDSAHTRDALKVWFPKATVVEDARDGSVATLALSSRANLVESPKKVGEPTEACTA